MVGNQVAKLAQHAQFRGGWTGARWVFHTLPSGRPSGSNPTFFLQDHRTDMGRL
jgi:hypothetical protein